MKYLVVGLGNMGAEYDQTRHNIGFEVLDSLAMEYNAKFKNEMLGDLCEIKYKGRAIYLLKPSTYVNLSGKAVNYWLQKLKIKQENLLIVLDDLNLDFNKCRLRGKGKDGGHNGLKSIDQVLGRNDYARLKIGIGNNFPRGRQVDFVLGQWSKDEGVQLPEILTKAREMITAFCLIGIKETMSQYNN